MGNTVIDKKTEKHSFGFWPAKESVDTTISLVNMGSGKFGLSYESKFSGVKSGHVSGGPYEISGDTNMVVNESPKVSLNISNFSKTGSLVTMTVKITVDIPVIGTETIYNQTLSGEYTSTAGWTVAMNSLASELKKQKETV